MPRTGSRIICSRTTSSSPGSSPTSRTRSAPTSGNTSTSTRPSVRGKLACTSIELSCATRHRRLRPAAACGARRHDIAPEEVPMSEQAWRGVYPALTTKFKSDLRLDPGAMEKHFAWQIECGVDGLIVCGSLGENSVLTIEEKLEILRIAVRVSDRSVPLLL